MGPKGRPKKTDNWDIIKSYGIENLDTNNLNVPHIEITNELFIALTSVIGGKFLRRVLLHLAGYESKVSEENFLTKNNINHALTKINNKIQELHNKDKVERINLKEKFMEERALEIYKWIESDETPEDEMPEEPMEIDSDEEKQLKKREEKWEILRKKAEKFRKSSSRAKKAKEQLQEEVEKFKAGTKNTDLFKERENLRKKLSRANQAKAAALEKAERLSKENINLKKELEQEKKKNGDIVVLKKNGVYTNQTLMAIWELQTLAIPDSKIGQTMEIILRRLVNKSANVIPSEATIRRSATSAALLNVKQTAKLLEDSKGPSTISSDETSKSTDKIQVYIYSTATHNIHLGIKQVATKSAEESLKTLKNILDDISSYSNFEDLAGYIIENVRSLQGDRASTQDLFAKKFEEYRASILEARGSLENMTDQQRAETLRITILHCQMHILSNLTIHIMGAFIEHQKFSGMAETNREDPNVLILLQRLSSLISNRTGNRHGIIVDWKPWADDHSVQNSLLPSYLGNRFNITFEIAEKFNDIKIPFMQFAREQGLIPEKREIKEIDLFLKQDIVIAHLRVLTFFNIAVTGAMTAMAGWSANVLDTLKWVPILLEWVETIIVSPELIYDIESHPFVNISFGQEHEFGSYVKRMEKILEEDLDENFVTALVSALTATASHIRYHFKDFLPNGDIYENLEKYERILISAPSHNNLCESALGYVSYLYATRPNMTAMRREALTLLNKNKTMNYLKSLSLEEQDKLATECRRESNIFLKQYQHRVDQLKHAKLEKLKRDREERMEKEARQGEKIESLTDQMMENGFWVTQEKVETELNECSSDENRIKKLSFQLNFRRKILQQPGPVKLFAITSKGKKLRVEELKKKIEHLISLDDQLKNINNKFIGKQFLHRFQTSETSESETIEQETEDDGTVYDVYHGTIIKGVQSNIQTPVVYYVEYEKFENEIYAIPDTELEREIINNTIIIQ